MKVLLENIYISSQFINIKYYSKEICFAWLENVNKFYPDIFCFDIGKYCLLLDYMKLIRKFNCIERAITFKLSMSNSKERLSYEFTDLFCTNLKKLDICLPININEKNELIIEFKSKVQKSIEVNNKYSNFFFQNNKNKTKCCGNIKNKKYPAKIIVIGTCFSRNVFKSDNYFNPNYKKYFNVVYTAFHNSIISLMSEPIDDSDYLVIKDLHGKEVFKYIEIEFKKNLFDIVDTVKPDYIILDNYIDSTRSVVEFEPNKFLTYNKYFSESIYKRKFSNCKILDSNSDEYKEYYERYVLKFATELQKRKLDNKLIIIGGRFSKKKVDLKSKLVSNWEKKDWIIPNNYNWDIIDSIMLKYIPAATYIDMRECKWVSDIDSPILGGASPSHYQSGYYKEIFNKIKEIIF